MNTRALSSINRPVPELLVADVERAQRYYGDTLGSGIEWLAPGKETAAFRRRAPPFEPAVNWVFAEDVDSYVRRTEVVRSKNR